MEEELIVAKTVKPVLKETYAHPTQGRNTYCCRSK